MVPFALVAQKTQTVTPETVALRLFPLDMSPVPPRDEGQRSGDAVVYVQKTVLKFICKAMMSLRSGRAIY